MTKMAPSGMLGVDEAAAATDTAQDGCSNILSAITQNRQETVLIS